MPQLSPALGLLFFLFIALALSTLLLNLNYASRKVKLY